MMTAGHRQPLWGADGHTQERESKTHTDHVSSGKAGDVSVLYQVREV